MVHGFALDATIVVPPQTVAELTSHTGCQQEGCLTGDTASVVSLETVGDFTHFVLSIVGEGRGARGADSVLVDASGFVRLASSVGIRVVVHVAFQADNSVGIVHQTVRILNDTVSLDQSELTLTLNTF